MSLTAFHPSFVKPEMRCLSCRFYGGWANWVYDGHLPKRYCAKGHPLPPSESYTEFARDCRDYQPREGKRLSSYPCNPYL